MNATYRGYPHSASKNQLLRQSRDPLRDIDQEAKDLLVIPTTGRKAQTLQDIKPEDT